MNDNKILVRNKRRRKLTVCREAADLTELFGALPGERFEYKIVSFCRISAAAFLRWVSSQTVIQRLSVSTFRVGPRALKLLSGLRSQGRLHEARFVVGRLASSAKTKNREYEYFTRLVSLCRRYDWEVASINNHSKIMLFDTGAGRFVLEGSSNLNEAPNWEQYTFQQDGELYAFYSQLFDEMFSFAARAEQIELPQSEAAECGLLWPDCTGQRLWK